jgi:siroheme synthase-like protein
MVIAATASNEVYHAIYREAHRRGVLCNIVDVPELCDFYYGSVVERENLQIAISTAGASPSLAKRLRKKLQVEFGHEYGSWLRALAEERRKIRERNLSALEKMRLREESASESAFLEYPEKARLLYIGSPGKLANGFLIERAVSGKSENDLVNAGELWWA